MMSSSVPVMMGWVYCVRTICHSASTLSLKEDDDDDISLVISFVPLILGWV